MVLLEITNVIIFEKINLRVDDLNRRLDLARLLVFRLERLSADSFWAHRASGIRGSLLKTLDQVESAQTLNQPADTILKLEHLDQLVKNGFEILEKAAREIRPPGEQTSSG
jgi:hypothetical protein